MYPFNHRTYYKSTNDTCYLLLFLDGILFEIQRGHPECKIGQRTFENLKPWYVKPLRDRNVCCWIYHVEMDLMRIGLNTLQEEK